jgi:hypothetical protein
MINRLAKVGYQRVQEIEDPELATLRTREWFCFTDFGLVSINRVCLLVHCNPSHFVTAPL